MTKPVPKWFFHIDAQYDRFDKLAIKVRLRCLTKEEAQWLWDNIDIMDTFKDEDTLNYIADTRLGYEN